VSDRVPGYYRYAADSRRCRFDLDDPRTQYAILAVALAFGLFALVYCLM
jgi:hypothetical protein